MTLLENDIKISPILKISYTIISLAYIFTHFFDLFMGINLHVKPGDAIGEIFFTLNSYIYIFVIGFVLFVVAVLSNIRLYQSQINRALTYGGILCIYAGIDFVLIIYSGVFSLRYILWLGISSFFLIIFLKYKRKNQLSTYALEVKENKIAEREKEIEQQEKILESILSESDLPIQENINVYICYADEDVDLFKIKEVAKMLVNSKEIRNVLYPQPEIDKDILEYIGENIKKCDLMLLFCSPNVMKSKPTEDQWTEAEIMGKPIIPIFLNPNHIPNLLRSRLGIEYDVFNIKNNINKLKELIFKKLPRNPEIKLNKKS